MKTIAIILILAPMFFLAVACSNTYGTQFDDTKVQQIERGKTTQADILKLFGEPFGKNISSDGKVQWAYQYVHSVAYGGVTSKQLLITFNKDNIAENYSYQEAGK